MNTETPSDWRRLFAGHYDDCDAYRVTLAAGTRGSYVSTRPDRSLARVKLGDVNALKCAEHGALVPSDMADAVHDEALALARDYSEAKHVVRVRYRLELLSEGETIGRTSGRWAPIEAADVPEDDGTDDGAKELRSLALLRHADRQVRELHKLNLEQAERYVQLAEQHGAAVQSYNEALLGMVHTIAAEREASDRPAALDPEVAREGLEILRTFITMQAQAKASEVKKDFHYSQEASGETSDPIGRDADICRDVLRSLTPLQHDTMRERVPEAYALLVRCATDWSLKHARELREMVQADPARFMALGPELIGKLTPLNQLDLDR